MEVNKPIDLVAGIYAVPARGTVLHQMLEPNEPVQVRIGNRLVDVPKPVLPVVTIRQNGVNRSVVVMGPPWSLFNRYLAARDDEQREQVRRELETWHAAAARKKLQRAGSLAMEGVMSYAIGTPLVPKGEVWIGTRGIDVHPKSEGFCIRWPIASSNPIACRIRTVDQFGVYLNDEDLVVSRQGDSDGDLAFVVWLDNPGEPAERTSLSFRLEDIVDLDAAPQELPHEIERLDVQSLANGHSARSLVGIATWWTWVEARWGFDHHGSSAWHEAYDRYTPAIEAMMDGRKTGQAVELKDFGLGADAPDLGVLLRMALPGVRAMVAARSRPPDFTVPWRTLVRQYWSLRWSPEGVDLDGDI